MDRAERGDPVRAPLTSFRDPVVALKKVSAPMYRCYLTRGEQIVAAEDLDLATLSEAITAGYTRLEQKAVTDNVDGIEIWQDRSFLYKSRT
jgi:hypothetical protein